MKLCIVTHKVAKGDGQGRVNYEVVKESLNRGYEITLVASSIASELQHSPQIRWIKISTTGLPTVLLRNAIFSLRSAAWLEKHRSEFDLIKINGAITSVPSDINAVHFVHSSWVQSPAHTWQRRRDPYGFYQWLYATANAQWEKQAFERAKVKVAVSEKVAEELVEAGVLREQIRVILNGVDLEQFSPGHRNRAELGLPEDVLLAFFAGDLRTPRKNLDTVLQALVQISDLHLAVAGKTEGSPYPAMALKLDVGDRVHFLDYRNDLPALMQAVDFFVFPSRYEACALVLLEAMASGLPVITSKTAGGAELVTPDCGLVLSNPDDITALVGILRELSRQPKRREQMGKAARMVAEKHSWNHVAHQYINLFQELCVS